MGQLEEYKMKELWPERSNKITVLVHCLNRAREMERLLKSVQWADRRIVLIDDRTTDNLEQVCHDYNAETEKFTWCDDFSVPKNILTNKVPAGEWCLVVGSDFECPPETATNVLDFINDFGNCMAKFNVYEYAEDPANKRTRMRVLLWRSHPQIYWEKKAHEEMKYSAFRLTRIGVAFRKDMDTPCLGDLIHYGDFENSKEEIWRKARYYNTLWEGDRIQAYANMQSWWGDLYSKLPVLATVDDVKNFMDARMKPDFKISEYGTIHNEDEIRRAMSIIRQPKETCLVDVNYD